MGQYGDAIAGYANLESSMTELFMFLGGKFNTDELIEGFSTTFPIVFFCFEMMMFIIITMYMAALSHRWRIMRRDAQEFAIVRHISVRLSRPLNDRHARATQALNKQF